MMKPRKKIFKIVIRCPNKESFRKLNREIRLDMGCSGPKRLKDGTIVTDAYVTQDVLKRLQKTNSKVEVIENATDVGELRKREVSWDNPFKDGRKIPRGPGKKE